MDRRAAPPSGRHHPVRACLAPPGRAVSAGGVRAFPCQIDFELSVLDLRIDLRDDQGAGRAVDR